MTFSPVASLRGGYPLLGDVLEFRRDPIALLARVRSELGDLGSFRLGPRRVLVASSAELAREILVDHADAFEKGPTVTRFARPVLGSGLIAATNAQSRDRRREVSSAFSPALMTFYGEQFRRAAERALGRWTDGLAIDLEAEMLKISLDALGRALFSVDLLDNATALSQSVAAILRRLTAQIRNPLGALLGGAFGGLRHDTAVLDQTIFGMIASRRRAGTRPRDLLTTLVESGLDDTSIRDALMNLFIAGHETSGTSLAWTWSLLARHPEALARVRDEAQSAATRDGPLTAASSESLPFLSQVVRESLRLYPPVHSLGRQASRDVAIGGHALSRGTVIIVSVYLLHRRPDYFPRPAEFRPERFSNDGEASFPKYAYLPFGAGPRACIGRQFGLMQAHIIMATLAARVSFTLEGGKAEPPPEMLITLRPRHGIAARVRLERS
jgi:cytochrome P450